MKEARFPVNSRFQSHNIRLIVNVLGTKADTRKALSERGYGEEFSTAMRSKIIWDKGVDKQIANMGIINYIGSSENWMDKGQWL